MDQGSTASALAAVLAGLARGADWAALLSTARFSTAQEQDDWGALAGPALRCTAVDGH